MKQRRMLGSVAVMLILAVTWVISGCGGGSDDSDGDAASKLVGTWSGTWVDTVWSMQGPITITITQDGNALSAEGTVGLTEFGLATATMTWTGTIDGDTVTFNGTATQLGTISGTVDGDTISGNGNIAGSLMFGAFTYTGTVSGDTITCPFQFTMPGGGAGTVTVTKQ